MRRMKLAILVLLALTGLTLTLTACSPATGGNGGNNNGGGLEAVKFILLGDSVPPETTTVRATLDGAATELARGDFLLNAESGNWEWTVTDPDVFGSARRIGVEWRDADGEILGGVQKLIDIPVGTRELVVSD